MIFVHVKTGFNGVASSLLLAYIYICLCFHSAFVDETLSCSDRRESDYKDWVIWVGRGETIYGIRGPISKGVDIFRKLGFLKNMI
jgi:hypothetical protein